MEKFVGLCCEKRIEGMIASYIKYFGIIISGFYVYGKILNIKRNKKTILLNLTCSIILSSFMYIVFLKCKFLIIPLLVFLSFAYLKWVYKIPLALSFNTTLISISISYIFNYISAIAMAAIFGFGNVEFSASTEVLSSLCVTIFQLLFIYLLFKIKRLKSGMPFLVNKADSKIGLLISLALIACFIWSSNAGSPTSYLFVIPIVFVILGSICIFVWWKNRLTKNYLKQLKNNEFQNLQNVLQKQKMEIERLKQHNDALAKIIHKDNKLIPAMELAVREYLEQSDLQDEFDIRQKGNALLKELESISGERSGVIKDYQHCHVKVPATGVLPIDSLLQYMCCKAQEAGIQLEFTLSASMKYLTENIIPPSDLRTILADLIENAIIAIKSNNSINKKILVSLGIINQSYEVDIYDSGIPFENETICHLGQKNNTTHANSGGSGIGLITVLETLRRYNASFYIEQIPNAHNIFTKKVLIRFDNLNECIFKTNNNELVHIFSAANSLNTKFENAKQRLIS